MTETVLVVEDSPDLMLMTSLMLQRSGYEVLEAVSGEAALTLVRATPKLDVILLDLRLPGIDGWEVLRQLKADGHTDRIPVIVLSAHADSDTAKKSVACGAKSYIEKPFRKETLVKALTAVLS